MSGGLTSYGRTDGDAPVHPDISFIAKALDTIRTAASNPGALVARADAMLVELDRLVRMAATSGDRDALKLAVGFCIQAREACFRKRAILEHRYQFAMELTAKAWMAAHPVDSLPISALVRQQLARIAASTSARARDRIDAQETIGVAASMYYLSAVFGGIERLTRHDLPPAVDPKSIYRSDTSDPEGATLLLCGSSYNANIVYSHQVAGDAPVVVVLEAKGGSSGVGKARMPAGMSDDAEKSVVRQNEYDYAIRSGYFMNKSKGPKGAAGMRNTFGNQILQADKNDRLMFAFVRGTAEDETLTANSRLALPSRAVEDPTVGGR